MWTLILSALTSRIAAAAYAGCVVLLSVALGVTVMQRNVARSELAAKTAELTAAQATVKADEGTIKAQDGSIKQLRAAIADQNASINALVAADAAKTKAAERAIQAVRAKADAAEAKITALLNTPVQHDPAEACKTADGLILDYAKGLSP